MKGGFGLFFVMPISQVKISQAWEPFLWLVKLHHYLFENMLTFCKMDCDYENNCKQLLVFFLSIRLWFPCSKATYNLLKVELSFMVSPKKAINVSQRKEVKAEQRPVWFDGVVQ